jgi:hypothetical protein
MSQLDISEEKKYIYEMMSDSIAEKRQLTNIILGFKSRLDELNSLELRGLESMSVKGYVDLHNARDAKRMITNIEREAQHTIKEIEKEAELKANPIEKEIIPKVEIEIEKEKEAKQTKRHGTMSLDNYAGIIAHILKEKGIPMKSKDLYELVNAQLDSPITRNNFSNNVLPRSAKVNGRINNVSHGYWQYLNK